MRRLVDLSPSSLAPALLVVAVGIGSTLVSRSNEIYFLNALVSVAIVVAIYVFIGNSGVLSFGQMSFVAVGAFAGRDHDDPARVEDRRPSGALPDPSRPHGRERRLAAARRRGRRRSSRSSSGCRSCGSRASPPASRPSRCSRSRTTSSASGRRSGRARRRSRSCPRRRTPCRRRSARSSSSPLRSSTSAAGSGRRLRASREDPAAARGVGVNVHRERLWAFAVSGALAGFAGAAARAPARVDHDRAGLPRADLPDPGDARRSAG